MRFPGLRARTGLHLAGSALASWTLLGCATAPLRPEIARHVVTIAADGSLAGASAPAADVAAAPDTSRHTELFAALQQHAETTGQKRVVVFIHGGLNSRSASAARATELTPIIEQTGAFPIFVHWRSSLLSSYAEHIAHVRQGRTWHPVPAALTVPAVVASDVLRAFARIPIVSLLQVGHAVDDVGQWFFEERWRDSEKRVEAGRLVDLDSGTDRRSKGARSRSSVLRMLFFPTQLASAGIVDAVGKSAWDVMLRRTDLMFHRESGSARGALAGFLDELSRRIDPSWEVTLIGHSMGTIVVNRILTEHDGIEFDRIVYMGAAATVGDYEDAVFPYLRSHRETEMFHLTLHHKSEVRETYFAPVLQGSLLVWIDDFLSTPITPRGRTVGRYVNLISAVEETPDALRARIHVKEFDAGAGEARVAPQQHGGFTDCRFWAPSFWTPDAHEELCPHGQEPALLDARATDPSGLARVER